MALIWTEGFDTSVATSTITQPGGGIQRRYESASAAFTFSTRASAHALVGGNLVARAVSSFNASMITRPLTAAPVNTVVLGFAAQATSSSSSQIGSGAGFGLRNDDGEQLRIEFVAHVFAHAKPNAQAWKFQMVRGATVLATSNEAFYTDSSPKGWLWCELKATIDNAAGSFELRVRSRRLKSSAPVVVTWDSPSSGIDTQGQATTGVNRLEIDFSNTLNRNITYDDIYLLDTSGAQLNDFVGGLVFERIVVQGDGNQTDWPLQTAASTEDAWHEDASIINDDKRVTSDTPGQITLAAMADPVRATTQVSAVCVSHHSRMESAVGTLTLAFRYRNSTGEADGGTYLVPDNAIVSYEDFRAVDPSTGLPWVPANLASLELGVRNLG